MTERIAIIGGGRIGEALLAGLVESGKQIKDLVVVERAPRRADEIAETYGVLVTDLANAVDSANIVVVAVKPVDIDAFIADLAGSDDDNEVERVVVSLVAGVSTAQYENALPAGSPVVRVMPNTPMLVGEGMSGVAPGRFARPEHVDAVVSMMESVGKVAVIAERQMDALTAVSGSGPAYAFLLAEAMVDAGVGLGLTRALATELAAQTIRGAGVLLTDSGASPTELRAAVTSPGGTTAAAIRELERRGVRSAVYEAAVACAEHSARGLISAIDESAGRTRVADSSA